MAHSEIKLRHRLFYRYNQKNTYKPLAARMLKDIHHKLRNIIDVGVGE